MPTDDDDISKVRAFPTRPPRAPTPPATERRTLEVLFAQMTALTERVTTLERERNFAQRLEDGIREAATKIEEVLHARQDKLRDTLVKWRASMQESLARAVRARTEVSLPPVPELPKRAILPTLPYGGPTGAAPPRDPDPRKR